LPLRMWSWFNDNKTTTGVIVAGLAVGGLFLRKRQQKTKQKEDSIMYLKEGIVNHKAGNFQEAVESFTKGINCKPDVKHFINRSSTYIMLNKFEEAKNDASAALKLGGGLKALYFKARALFGLKKFRKAKRCLDNILSSTEDKEFSSIENFAKKTLDKCNAKLNEKKMAKEQKKKAKQKPNYTLKSLGINLNEYKLAEKDLLSNDTRDNNVNRSTSKEKPDDSSITVNDTKVQKEPSVVASSPLSETLNNSTDIKISTDPHLSTETSKQTQETESEQPPHPVQDPLSQPPAQVVLDLSERVSAQVLEIHGQTPAQVVQDLPVHVPAHVLQEQPPEQNPVQIEQASDQDPTQTPTEPTTTSNSTQPQEEVITDESP